MEPEYNWDWWKHAHEIIKFLQKYYHQSLWQIYYKTTWSFTSWLVEDETKACSTCWWEKPIRPGISEARYCKIDPRLWSSAKEFESSKFWLPVSSAWALTGICSGTSWNRTETALCREAVSGVFSVVEVPEFLSLSVEVFAAVLPTKRLKVKRCRWWKIFWAVRTDSSLLRRIWC